MRHEPTDAERKLWYSLRGRRFAEYKFRRQVPIGPYIADFVCHERKLIVELDGSQHADAPRDAARDAWFVAHGYRTLRFWNTDFLTRRADALDGVFAALQLHSLEPNERT
jgi:very-short-patch-repair endonuclease